MAFDLYRILAQCLVLTLIYTLYRLRAHRIESASIYLPEFCKVYFGALFTILANIDRF
jgi:hypothetical protein